MVDISVVIVNWNTNALLQRCLESLRRYALSEEEGEFAVELWVVDNGSSDGSPEMVAQQFPTVRLIRNEANLGFAQANNLALPHTTGRYMLLLNSDTELQSGVLQEMVTFMVQHPAVGIAGPKLLNPDGTPQYSCDAFPRRPFTLLRDKLGKILFQGKTRSGERERMAPESADEPVAVDYVIGAALLIRRETYEQIGGLDERFFMYAEDIDWCYRAAQAGWSTAYVGNVSLYHLNRGSSDASPELAARLARLRATSLLQFYRKHYGVLSALLMQVILFFKRLQEGIP
ncbi:glycosyltransferase [candidate division KSB3 bacterium]|uniref:Glycosyltransferase n=1 Tax=candidate division KSB3 bacterium TaxID=2044937 RepID=A0A9D5JWK3_9BACT|nr:glycosyltransferase [candidate division KSB3 bacterium]MBD3325607.1 glycosyltransferase [candidate division KSB3 bacterium]